MGELQPGQSRSVTLPVEGMTCASCVLRVEKALQKVTGVTGASVNLASEKARIEFDPAKVSIGALQHAVAGAGYTLVAPVEGERRNDDAPGESAAHARAFSQLRREWVLSLVFTVPVMALSMLSMTAWYMRSSPLSMDATNTLLMLLTCPVVFISGRRFYKGFWAGVRHLTADMNTLVAVGTGSAFIYSAIAVLFPALFVVGGKAPAVYFDTTATIITLILLGKVLETSARRRATDAIGKLLSLQPATAHVLKQGVEAEVPIKDVLAGDVLLVRPGERIPVDGVITKGETTLDESMVTGESLPAERKAGERLVGGTINLNGSIELRATAVGDGTVLARIVKMVEEAQGSKAPIQALADKIASVFVPVVIGIAILTFVLWLTIGGQPFTHALLNFIAVLIIACPCALGLATPTAIMVGSGTGAHFGIVFRNADSLERTHAIHTVVFDKTGTITEGRPAVIECVALNGTDSRKILGLAASLERLSEHPIARAITHFAQEQGIESRNVEAFQSLTGLGVAGVVDGIPVIVGSLHVMKDYAIPVEGAQPAVDRMADQGATAIIVAEGGSTIGVIAVADTIKPTSPGAIRALHEMGIETVLLTGDTERTAHTIASMAGIDRVIAGVLPHEKASHVKELQARGKVVAMVGDGINDAPAIAQADVGIAMGSGTDIAIEAAGITLMTGDLHGVVRAIRLSARIIATIRQNLFWAFIYNVIGIPLAAMGILDPMIAAAAMAFSSVSVVANSLRLKRFH